MNLCRVCSICPTCTYKHLYLESAVQTQALAEAPDVEADGGEDGRDGAANDPAHRVRGHT
jgi:hypothetical protein